MAMRFDCTNGFPAFASQTNWGAPEAQFTNRSDESERQPPVDSRFRGNGDGAGTTRYDGAGTTRYDGTALPNKIAAGHKSSHKKMGGDESPPERLP